MAASSSEPEVFYFVSECPLGEGCTSASWKKARVWGWTPEECKAKLRRHLMMSGNHKVDEVGAELMAEAVTLDTMDWKPEEKGGNSSAASASQHLAKRARQEPPDAAFAIGARVPEASRCGPVSSGSADKIDTALDSITRGFNAARHAQKLSAAAAEAFASEAEVLLEAKSALEAIKAMRR